MEMNMAFQVLLNDLFDQDEQRNRSYPYIKDDERLARQIQDEEDRAARRTEQFTSGDMQLAKHLQEMEDAGLGSNERYNPNHDSLSHPTFQADEGLFARQPHNHGSYWDDAPGTFSEYNNNDVTFEGFSEHEHSFDNYGFQADDIPEVQEIEEPRPNHQNDQRQDPVTLPNGSHPNDARPQGVGASEGCEATVAKFPVVLAKNLPNPKPGFDGKTCPVCQDEYSTEKNAQVTLMPCTEQVQHRIHTACLTEHIKHGGEACPTCKVAFTDAVKNIT